jgi:hypothetical protein
MANQVFLQIFPSHSDFRGGFCGIKIGQAPFQPFAEARDGLDSNFQGPCQSFRFGDAGIEESEEFFKAARFSEVKVKFGGEPSGLCGGFLVKEGLKGAGFRGRDEFDDTGGFAVVCEDRSEVGFVDGEEVFLAMVQTVYAAPDEAAEFAWEEVGRVGGLSVGVGRLSSKEFEDSFGGDGVGVVAVGHDAAEGATPVQWADLLLGVVERLPEHLVPGLVRASLLNGVSALRAGERNIRRARAGKEGRRR